MGYLHYHIFRLAMLLSLVAVPVTGLEPPAERPVVKVLPTKSGDIAGIGFYYGYYRPYRYYGRPYNYYYGYRRYPRYYRYRPYGYYNNRRYYNYRSYRHHDRYRYGTPRYRGYRYW